MSLDLREGQRAERKTLITVAEWTVSGSTSSTRQILGARTEDSSIELNPDVATSTDILGITYTDVNKTEPTQTFDPFFVMGGSALAEYLVKNTFENNISAYNGVFDIYIITAFDKESDEYLAYKHEGCSIIPQSVGGDSYTNIPIEVHLSNKITKGTVNKLDNTFTFSPISDVVIGG